MISTVKEAAGALQKMGFPVPSMDVFGAISRNCREEFLADLTLCAGGKDADGAARARIERIVSCTTPNVVTAVGALGLTLSLDDLVGVSRKIPVRFMSAVAAAADSTNPKCLEARDYLKKIADTKPWLVPVAAAAPPDATQPPRQGAAPASRATPPSAPVGSNEPPPYGEERRGGDNRPAATSANRQEQRRPAPKTDRDKDYRSAHVYGGSYALCFNAIPGRDDVPGMMVDAAVSAGPKDYDWANAIHIMLDVREVACVLAVFRNWRKGVEFSAHGRQNDKSFSIERQGPHYYCKVSAKRDGGNGGVRAVRILPVDAHKVGMLFLEQLLLAYPTLPPSEVIAMAKAINSEVPEGQRAA